MKQWILGLIALLSILAAVALSYIIGVSDGARSMLLKYKEKAETWEKCQDLKGAGLNDY